jgi:hypothetical protein
VIKSIQQAMTGRKIPFARTPKVKNRTATPALYVLAPIAIIAFSAFTFVRDYRLENWGNAIFAAFNGLLTLYALVAYQGIKNSIIDVWLGMTSMLYVKDAPSEPRVPEDNASDWRSALYYGAEDQGTTPHGFSTISLKTTDVQAPGQDDALTVMTIGAAAAYEDAPGASTDLVTVEARA